MKSLKVFGVATLVFVLCLAVFPLNTYAQKSSNVTVMNTANNPVPVQITKQGKLISTYLEWEVPASPMDPTVTVMTVPAGKAVVITDVFLAAQGGPLNLNLYEDTSLKIKFWPFFGPTFFQFNSGIPFGPGTNIIFRYDPYPPPGPVLLPFMTRIFISGYEIDE